MKKGFDAWVEIFRGGLQRDNAGTVHDGDAIIDRAVETFDPKFHEPPACIGHPEHDAPAYGWAKEIKAQVVDGAKRLYAKFDKVVPEFADAVQAGLYKKRSAAFYPDGRLRHVGWLGAMPPAVKGQADMAFAEGAKDEDFIAFEFSESEFAEPSPWIWRTISGVLRRLREHLIETDGTEAADKAVPEYAIEEIEGEYRRASEAPTDEETDMEFSEFMELIKFWKKSGGKIEDADLSAIKAAGVGGARFSEADLATAKKEAAAKAEADAKAKFDAEQATAARRAEVAEFAEGYKDKIVPALMPTGLVEFCQAIEQAGPIEFSEGEGKDAKEKKVDPLDWLKGHLDALAKLTDTAKGTMFSELATKDAAGGDGDLGTFETLTDKV